MIVGAIPDALLARLRDLSSRAASRHPERPWTLNVVWRPRGLCGTDATIGPWGVHVTWSCALELYLRPGFTAHAVQDDPSPRASFLRALDLVQSEAVREATASATRARTGHLKRAREHDRRTAEALGTMCVTLLELRLFAAAEWVEAPPFEVPEASPDGTPETDPAPERSRP